MRRHGAARRRTCLSTPSLVSSRPGRARPPAPAPEDWPAPMRRLDGRVRKSRGAEAVSGGGEACEAQAKRCSLNFPRRTRDSGTARPAMTDEPRRCLSGRRVGASPPRCRLWSKLELHAAALPVLLHSDFVCGCDAPARARCGRRRGGLKGTQGRVRPAVSRARHARRPAFSSQISARARGIAAPRCLLSASGNSASLRCERCCGVSTRPVRCTLPSSVDLMHPLRGKRSTASSRPRVRAAAERALRPLPPVPPSISVRHSSKAALHPLRGCARCCECTCSAALAGR